MKDGDFVEIDYIGSVKETGEEFDFTTGKKAEEMGVEEPVVVVVGAGQVLPGLDSELKKHKAGDEFEVDIPPEKAFGPRTGKLVKLVSRSEFKKHDLSPYPGMRVDFDGARGTVRSVSGGRVIVDFNHPLAGKTLHYWARINRRVTKKRDKVEALLNFAGLKDFDLRYSKKVATVKTENPVPESAQNRIEEMMKEHIDLKRVNFEQKISQRKSK